MSWWKPESCQCPARALRLQPVSKGRLSRSESDSHLSDLQGRVHPLYSDYQRHQRRQCHRGTSTLAQSHHHSPDNSWSVNLVPLLVLPGSRVKAQPTHTWLHWLSFWSISVRDTQRFLSLLPS